MARSFLSTTATRRALGLLTSAWIDARYGDPPNSRHPVAWLGRAAKALERYAPADDGARRNFGAAVALGLPAKSAAIAGTAVGVASALPFVGPLTGSVAGGGLLALASSRRTLLARASEVADALERGDLEEARALTATHLVSRDTSMLDDSGVAAAVIESLAENLSDGVVASWFWFAVAGAPGAWAHRAANTLDAMWGYRGQPYEELGMPAARLDDAFNVIPARLTALAILAAARGKGARTWWHAHGLTSSPNAGHPMSAMAGALEVRLGKDGEYVLGDGLQAPTPHDIRRAIRLARRASIVALIALTIAVARRPR